MRAVAACACATVPPAAAFLYTQPTYSSHPSQHAPLTSQDCAVLRAVGKNETQPDTCNPGVRAFPSLLSPPEAQELLEELQPIKSHYGLSLIGPREGAMYKWQQSLLAPSKRLPPVDMLRITGRPESEMQRVAPWGYGDGFDESKIPPKLAALVSRVRALPGLRLGPLRDITINYRHSGFLRLDPHIDPALDGENVFIIGVDSDTVLTLCPAARRELWRWLGTAWDAILLRDERERVVQDARNSWTPWDIDVLARARTMIHLSGDARWSWTHGTRVGIPATPSLQDQLPPAAESTQPPAKGSGSQGLQESNHQLAKTNTLAVPWRFWARSKPEAGSEATGSMPASSYALHDFWGTPDSLVVRGKERHSVVLAFAKVPE